MPLAGQIRAACARGGVTGWCHRLVSQVGVTSWLRKDQQFQTLFPNFCSSTAQRASGQGAEILKLGDAREGRLEL